MFSDAKLMVGDLRGLDDLLGGLAADLKALGDRVMVTRGKVAVARESVQRLELRARMAVLKAAGEAGA